MSDAAIQALVESNPGQATFDEYKLVHNAVTERAPCNMLVFGVGRDTPLWMTANAGGRTVFLENKARWVKVARELSPGIVVYRVRYPTIRALAPVLRFAPFFLRMPGLPTEVTNTKWDIILVDAPRGTTWRRPGRAMSIYTASRLARLGGSCDVFVHDTHRDTERNASDWFLGPALMVRQAGTMRQYRVP